MLGKGRSKEGAREGDHNASDINAGVQKGQKGWEKNCLNKSDNNVTGLKPLVDLGDMLDQTT